MRANRYRQEKHHEALLFMRTHPVETMGFIFRRFSGKWIAMWDPPSDIWSRVDLETKLGILGNGLFRLLSLMGVLLAYRQRNEIAVPLASVMLFFPLVFYVTHTSSRYRHPMDPIMLVLAVYALAYPVTHVLKRFSGLEARIPAHRTTDLTRAGYSPSDSLSA